MLHAPDRKPETPVTLAEKVAYLSDPKAFGAASVERRETHMSWVFMAGDRVYKLKKPVRFPYLDFSTLERREAACRAELRLNARLAPDIYLGVAPLTRAAQGLAIAGDGPIVDWLVVMRRLDENDTLEQAIAARKLGERSLSLLAGVLIDFYRHASPVFISAETHLADWRESIDYNRRILLDARSGMPSGLVSRIDRAQRRFLAEHPNLLRRRVRERRIVDGHGDLRPEHIFIDDKIRIIDSLEFSARLRANDPFDEIAFLGVECERLGMRWAGDYLKNRLLRAFGDGIPDALFRFYRCHRATLRARLSIAHLLEPNPRAPEKWPRQCRSYLSIAARDARWLDRWLQNTSRSLSPRLPCKRRIASANSGAAARTSTFLRA